MRLINEVIEDLRGLPDVEVTPMGAGLEELLGGQGGSLPELADRFTAAGLGHIMASWIGHGANLPISPRDLRSILGEERWGTWPCWPACHRRIFWAPGSVAADRGSPNDVRRHDGLLIWRKTPRRSGSGCWRRCERRTWLSPHLRARPAQASWHGRAGGRAGREAGICRDA
jgi:hypothetical protein